MRIIKTCLLSMIALILLSNLSFGGDDFIKESRVYRKKGYEAQQSGDIEMALVYYRKAAALDPFYAIPHNDTGIIYEMKGYLNKAQEAYLKAIQINPEFAEAHMNLALLYERINEIDKALPHFIKRVELDSKNSSWARRAWQKLWKYAPEQAREVEARVLAREVANRMQEQKETKKVLAAKHYQKGIYYLKKDLYENAYNELKQAVILFPDNESYQKNYRKAERKHIVNRISIYCKNGSDYIESGDYVKAKQELEKIIELVPRQN
ncbi:MAG: tetratricopeptide repeat protein [Candidatus Kaelpia imicola]|nr:tetratricopeptide repeat protein [Candidatus Kaelpia imicola]